MRSRIDRPDPRRAARGRPLRTPPAASRASALSVGAALLALLAVSCGGEGAGREGGATGLVSVDGSSTVYPITEAVAEEFQLAHRGARVTVGISGTGGGFKKFCGGETDVSDASRPIRESERETCAAAGIEYVELPVAWDGITVAVQPRNDWVSCLTVAELERIWRPGSRIRRWRQVRDGFPDREIALFGPDTDSGTFDYFTEAILGESGASRSDYTASADDNVLVMGVAGEPGALGYFGYAYYEENRDRIDALAIDGGSGCVEPTRESIEAGEYTPLSRPLFIYVKRSALARPAVRSFVEFYLEEGPALVPQVGYVPLSEERYEEVRARLREALDELGSAETATAG